MLDKSLLRSLLDNEFYEQNKSRIKRDIFGEDFRELYDVVKNAHEKYQHNLTTVELNLMWELSNPVATRAEKADMEALITSIDNADKIAPDVASDAIKTLYLRTNAQRMTSLSLELMEGNKTVLPEMDRLFELLKHDPEDDEFGPATTQDFDEVFAHTRMENRFQFNLKHLNENVPGIGRRDFAIFFANPEVGKTSAVLSFSVGPGGFVEQGAKVLILGNEEDTKKTVARAYLCASGMTEEQALLDPETCKHLYNERVGDKLTVMSTQDWDLDKLERYIEKTQPDVVWVDQGDKVQINGKFNASHERLRELYRRLRETAKKYDCAVFSVSQASADAEHKTRLNYTMMEGSKIGKAAEADLIIGAAKQSGSLDSDEPDNTRFLTVSKNKLSGWHGTVVCKLQPEVSRYVD